MPATMSQNFMTSTVRQSTQWVFQALELGCSGVQTGIDRGPRRKLRGIAESGHVDELLGAG